MRWPSDTLIDRLRELQLCNRKDIERCAADVRRLATEIPDFDSIWVDALVKRGVLTPLQADFLLTDSYQNLRHAEWLLQEQLGAGRFTAIDQNTSRSVFIDRIPLGASDTASVHARVEALLVKLPPDAQFTNLVAYPESLQTLQTKSVQFELQTITAFQSGWLADELLVRGGRFPWPAVTQIGRQLLQAVDWLDSNGLVHGDIRVQNLHISGDRIILLRPFVRRLIRPTQAFSSGETVEQLATTAPELIGTGQPATTGSDVFSIGCVLWELLTNRPPCPSMDRTLRLQQLQRIKLPDVRELVPDCPAGLAESIHLLTQRRPEIRCPSIVDTVQTWESLNRIQSGRIRSLQSKMPKPKLASPRFEKRGGAFAAVMAVMFCLSLVMVAFGWQRGLLPKSLNMTVGRQPIAESVVNRPEVFVESQSPPLLGQMPAPDSAGVIVLTSGQTYASRDLKFAGDLFIESSGARPALVTVDDSGWNLEARRISLQGIHVVPQSEMADIVRIRSTLLSCQQCRFGNYGQSQKGHCLTWSHHQSSGSVLRVQDSVFVGRGYALNLGTLPGRCEVNNVLLRDCGLLKLNVDRQQTEWEASVHQVTQLGGAGVVDVVDQSSGHRDFRLRLHCGNSVFAPTHGIIRWAGNNSWVADGIHVEFLLPEQGNPTVVPPELSTASYLDRSLKQFVEFSDDKIIPQSLLIAALHFRGQTQTSLRDADAELLDYEGPKLNAALPGAVISQLPSIVGASQ